MRSVDEIKQITKNHAKKEGIHRLDIVRVVNNGDTAHVGAMGWPKLPPLSSRHAFVFSIDLNNDTVISQESWSGFGLNVKNASEKMASKLDNLEGVEIERDSSGGGVIDSVQKLNDISKGDWTSSPKCPECGSQKVGQENKNAYQCRECGTMIYTGEDIHIE